MACDDDWDRVVLLEALAFEKGRKEAMTESARDDDIIKEGERVGIISGYPIALELYFYRFNINCFLESSPYKLSEVNSMPLTKERLVKRCTMLVDKIDSLPSYNDTSFDFKALLETSRNLYKLISKEVNLPLFSPIQESKNSVEW